MLDSQQVERLIETVGAMDRAEALDHLLNFRSAFPVDFTAEYLDRLSLDRLKHILVAACMQAGQVPAGVVADAA